MQSERVIDRLAGCLENTVGEHECGSAVALFAGLEHEDHLPVQMFALFAEQPSGTDQAGGMQVVPAGMHAPRNQRGVIDTTGLLEWKGVHVRAQQHRRSCVFTA